MFLKIQFKNIIIIASEYPINLITVCFLDLKISIIISDKDLYKKIPPEIEKIKNLTVKSYRNK